MKATRSMIGEGARRMVLGCAVAGGLWLGGAGQSFAQVAPADLPPALQQVVNLSKAGMSDDFIETYITNSGRTYSGMPAQIARKSRRTGNSSSATADDPA